MKKPCQKFLLSGKEFDALEKLARKSKIDRWFSLEDRTDPATGISFTGVYDLERRRHLTLRYGVGLLLEGASPFDSMGEDYGLTRKEVSAIKAVAGFLGLRQGKDAK
jgi:hypothetical protein